MPVLAAGSDLSILYPVPPRVRHRNTIHIHRSSGEASASGRNAYRVGPQAAHVGYTFIRRLTPRLFASCIHAIQLVHGIHIVSRNRVGACSEYFCGALILIVVKKISSTHGSSRRGALRHHVCHISGQRGWRRPKDYRICELFSCDSEKLTLLS